MAVEHLGVPAGAVGFPTAISDDGNVVLMDLATAPTTLRWTRDRGPEPLPAPIGSEVYVGHMSSDGRVMVGSLLGPPDFLFKLMAWRDSGPPTQIDQLGAFSATVAAISRDGQTIAAISSGGGPAHQPRAFVTTLNPGAGVVELGSLGLPGGIILPEHVSDDGQVITGISWPTPPVASRAFRWTRNGGMRALSPMGSGPDRKVVMSVDGSVVAWLQERSPGFSDLRIMRWTSSSGVVVLGGPSGEAVEQLFMSDDGATLAGYATGGGFLWSESGGFRRPFSDPTLRVTALSPGGEVVALRRGLPHELFGDRLFRWSAVDGLEELGRLSAGLFSSHYVMGISRDEETLYGLSTHPSDRFPVVWRRDQTVGFDTCGPARPTSTGAPGTLQILGSNVITLQSMSLHASDLPPATTGFFLASNASIGPMPITSSMGLLCLGGAIGRYAGPGQIQNSGANGEFELAIDPTAITTPTGSVQPTIGESWTFQAWFRDANPQPTSNFTNAVTVRLY